MDGGMRDTKQLPQPRIILRSGEDSNPRPSRVFHTNVPTELFGLEPYFRGSCQLDSRTFYLDQDQGEDHCTSMVYSNGQSTNTLSRKQRKNLRNKIKQNIKKKENKFNKKLEERKMPSDS